MPHQIKGKSLSLSPKIIALDRSIEIIKLPKNSSHQNPDDEPAKQHFQVFIANPPQRKPDTTTNTKEEQI